MTVLFADLCDWQLRQEKIWRDKYGEMFFKEVQ